MRHDPEDSPIEVTVPSEVDENADDVEAETADDGALEDAAVVEEEPLAEEEMNSGERNPFHYGF